MYESARKLWRVIVFLGLLNALFGLAVLFAPYRVPRTMEVMLAVIILLGGVILTAHAVINKGREGNAYNIIQVVLRFVTGGILLVGTPDTFMTAVILIGIYFGLDGALSIGSGLSMREYKEFRSYMMAIGITSIVFSILIWLRIVGTGIETIRILVGILFLLRGAIITLGGFNLKNLGQTPPPQLPDTDKSEPAPSA
jgi:uncharacterized membrane protein HdeD (DUF308 family)